MAHRLAQQPKTLINIPVFLAPAFSTVQSCVASLRSFSSSSRVDTQIQRGRRDKSRNRGVSVIRSTGPRQRLAVTRLGPLPKPVADPTEARAYFEVNPNHGLWGFFNEGKDALIPPGEENSHGRAWTERELSRKSWEDLHRLYWVCVKEANVVYTRSVERRRLRAGYGEQEAEERLKVVKKTMHMIKQVLMKRHYAHFDAMQLLDEKHLFELFPDVLQDSVDPSLLETRDTNAEDAESASVEEPLLSPRASSAESSIPLEQSSVSQKTR